MKPDPRRLKLTVKVGIMRCAAFSAVMNRPLYVPPDAPEGRWESGGSAIDHFYDKLLLIKERLKTDAGCKMGEKRHKTVSGFCLLS